MLLIGNLISLVAAGFMAASCISQDNRRVFLYQSLECALIAVASVFFQSYAAVTTMILSALRNWFVAKNRYTRSVMIVFVIVTTVLGIAVNTRGLLGLMPVIATAEYAICCHYIRGVLATKYSILINVLLWVIYSFLVMDFSTAISDSVMLVLDTIVIIQMHRQRRKHSAQPAQTACAK